MLAGKREQRVGEQILKELSDIILRKVKDPRLQGVTITDVGLSKDLRIATVYYSLIGDDEKKAQAQVGFESATKFIRKELGRRLHLRYTPAIRFRYDISLEYGQKMEEILSQFSPG